MVAAELLNYIWANQAQQQLDQLKASKAMRLFLATKLPPELQALVFLQVDLGCLALHPSVLQKDLPGDGASD